MQIRLIPREDGIAEWTMIELQGTLDSAGVLAGQRIGNLKWENRKALLHIGHHIMEGKEVKLQNPLIVLARDAENQEIVQIAAVIRKKVQFRARPMPIKMQIHSRNLD
ncbi:Chromosome transmission fidelity protein [Dirofilaria immitis]